MPAGPIDEARTPRIAGRDPATRAKPCGKPQAASLCCAVIDPRGVSTTSCPLTGGGGVTFRRERECTYVLRVDFLHNNSGVPTRATPWSTGCCAPGGAVETCRLEASGSSINGRSIDVVSRWKLRISARSRRRGTVGRRRTRRTSLARVPSV
jgi:hypothetical protein